MCYIKPLYGGCDIQLRSPSEFMVECSDVTDDSELIHINTALGTEFVTVTAKCSPGPRVSAARRQASKILWCLNQFRHLLNISAPLLPTLNFYDYSSISRNAGIWQKPPYILIVFDIRGQCCYKKYLPPPQMFPSL